MISVSLYGAGQVNGNVRKILENRPGFEVMGPYGRDRRTAALTSAADVVVIATTSFLSEVAPDIRDAVNAGSNVITTAEEAAFPQAVDPHVAAELDQLARERGVTVLGAGLNPGFAFDALVVTATGAAWEVESIRVERVVNLSRFSHTILRRLGLGYTQAEFESGVAGGTIFGHIGFPQSMRVVARTLGVELERVDKHIEGIYARAAIDVNGFPIAAGATEGFVQRYTGIVDGRPWFEAEFTGHIDPSSYGIAPRDAIHILGATEVHMGIEPGLDPQISSSAVIANSVSRLVDARPGWLTVADLPPAAPRRVHPSE